LLQTPIEDYKKYVVSLILATYLIHIKCLPFTESYNVIKEWLVDRCSKLRTLNFDFNYRIKYALDNAIKKGYKPISFEKLKERNIELYHKLLLQQQ
jgi:hypothetical protein